MRKEVQRDELKTNPFEQAQRDATRLREEAQRLEKERAKLTDDLDVSQAALTDVGETIEDHTLLVSCSLLPPSLAIAPPICPSSSHFCTACGLEGCAACACLDHVDALRYTDA